MMKRRIFLWMGLIVLFVAFGLNQEAIAKEYKVKRGDSLSKIAKKFNVTSQALTEANGLTSNALKPKQVLIIPDNGKKQSAKSKKSRSHKTDYYVVKKGDTLKSIAKNTGHSVKEIRKWNHVNSRSLKIGRKLVLTRPGPLRETARATAEESDQAAELDEMPDEENGAVAAVIPEHDLMDVQKDIEASSDLLGKWNNESERSLFIRVAKGFLGAPYRFGGSSVRGLDCSAFVRKIYEFFDINLPRTAREQARVGKYVAREELVEGDLVFFNTRRAFGHVGIYIGNNEFVHAAAGRERKVKIDTLDKPFYDKHFIKAVRIKGLDDKGT